MWMRLAVFGIATIASAIAFAALLGALGEALLDARGPWLVAAVAVVAAAVLLRETRFRGVRVPQLTWQVPREWLRSFWGGAAAFGAVMGMGVFTLQPSALFHAYLIGCVLAGSGPAAVAGAVYGGVYVAGVVWATVAWRGCVAGAQEERAKRLSARFRWLGLAGVPTLILLLS
jgi:hypothetical protein